MARKNFAHSGCAHIRIGFVTILAVSGAMAANNTSTTKPAIENYARPLSFEPNRGQTNKQVDFLAHGAGYSLFLSHAEAVMVLQRGAPPKPNPYNAPTHVNSAVVHMRPVGGNALARVDALGELPGKSNYFVGSVPERWHTGIPNYAKVRYGDVYPGVDMIYYGNQRQLEYDFVVKPGADPSSISLEFQGTSKAELDREGNVVMHTAAGDLRWHKPNAYQEIDGSRRPIACAYVRRDGQGLGFTLADYDVAKSLIIDPALEYSTYLGGSGGDWADSIAVDAAGNAYVTGAANSTDFPIKNAFQNEFVGGGNYDAFVTKFDPTGNLVYSTYLGAGGWGRGIAVNAQGNAYVTGITTSAYFPTKNALQNTLKGIGDAFVTKLDTDGNALVYSTYLGGSMTLQGACCVPGYDGGLAIAVDAHGNAYVTGFTFSTDFPTKNAFQNEFKGIAGKEDAFVTKLDADGDALVYSTYLSGTVTSHPEVVGDYGTGIAVDRHGNAYITGQTDSIDFPTKNALQNTIKGFFDAFVTKLDTDGDALVYSTYLGGTEADEGDGIAVDVHGNAYVAGRTSSTDFPTKNAFQNEGPGAFVTKLDADGDALVYSTYLRGADGARGIAVNAHGNAYVTGAAGPNFPTKNAFQNTLKGFTDAFVTKFEVCGCALVYSSYLGGSNFDFGLGIAVRANGEAYVTGQTGSIDFPTQNAFQPMLGGPDSTSNAFVTKISAH